MSKVVPLWSVIENIISSSLKFQSLKKKKGWIPVIFSISSRGIGKMGKRSMCTRTVVYLDVHRGWQGFESMTVGVTETFHPDRTFQLGKHSHAHYTQTHLILRTILWSGLRFSTYSQSAPEESGTVRGAFGNLLCTKYCSGCEDTMTGKNRYSFSSPWA